QNVSKRYPRNEFRPSLRHEAGEIVKHLFRRMSPAPSFTPFLALKDISFTIRKGEAVGIVCRNGFGKNTLLRLLSGITRPSAGHIEVHGRFVSLIGLGAGFKPELTGRENIYLNAAIHGTPPADIKPVIDDIIEFSELGSFIDIPVNRYSS